MQKVITLALLGAGCVTEVIKPEDIVEPDDLVGIAENYCRTDVTLTCGKVYAFPEGPPQDNPIGMLELCVPWPDGIDPLRPTLAQAEAEWGPSILSPDPRFANANLCWWQCPGARGCNSFSGCYCGPAPAPEPMSDAGVDAPPVVFPPRGEWLDRLDGIGRTP